MKPQFFPIALLSLQLLSCLTLSAQTEITNASISLECHYETICDIEDMWNQQYNVYVDIEGLDLPDSVFVEIDDFFAGWVSPDLMQETGVFYNSNVCTEFSNQYTDWLSEEVIEPTVPEVCNFVQVCVPPFNDTQSPNVLCPEFCSFHEGWIIADENISSTFNCSVSVTGDCVEYLPLPALENIIDSVVVIRCDTLSEICDTAFFEIVIGCIAPIAKDDVYTLDGTATSYELDVLTNDGIACDYLLGISDVMSIDSTIGTVGINADGTALIFEPSPEFIGLATFDYIVANNCDDIFPSLDSTDVKTSQATVVINFKPPYLELSITAPNDSLLLEQSFALYTEVNVPDCGEFLDYELFIYNTDTLEFCEGELLEWDSSNFICGNSICVGDTNENGEYQYFAVIHSGALPDTFSIAYNSSLKEVCSAPNNVYDVEIGHPKNFSGEDDLMITQVFGQVLSDDSQVCNIHYSIVKSFESIPVVLTEEGCDTVVYSTFAHNLIDTCGVTDFWDFRHRVRLDIYPESITTDSFLVEIVFANLFFPDPEAILGEFSQWYIGVNSVETPPMIFYNPCAVEYSATSYMNVRISNVDNETLYQRTYSASDGSLFLFAIQDDIDFFSIEWLNDSDYDKFSIFNVDSDTVIACTYEDWSIGDFCFYERCDALENGFGSHELQLILFQDSSSLDEVYDWFYGWYPESIPEEIIEISLDGTFSALPLLENYDDLMILPVSNSAFNYPGMHEEEFPLIPIKVNNDIVSDTLATETICFDESIEIEIGGTLLQIDSTQFYYDVSPTDCNAATIAPYHFVREPEATLLELTICSNSSLEIGDTILTYDAPGLYEYTEVVAEGQSGCDLINTYNIMVFEEPTIQINMGQDSIEVINDESVILSVEGDFVEYLWEPNGETSSSIEVSESGVYEVTTIDENGCSAQTLVYANVYAVGLEDLESANPIYIYPNPVRDVLYLDGLPANVQSIEVYNQIGQQVLVYNQKISRVSVEALPVGTYFIKVSTAEYLWVEKVVVW